jgi:hypothetical protein
VGSKKQFNNILNECLERLLTGQETVEQCLQRYPEFAAELEPLLRTAVMMNKAADVKPSAEFRARARYQMQLKMTQAKTPLRITRAVPRWAIAVCTVMLVFVLGGGTVLAAANTMPGNPLYAVKLATENIQVKLAGSEARKAELYLAMTNERVTEMTWMVNNSKTQNLEAAAQRLNDYYVKISELPLAGNTAVSFTFANSETNQIIANPASTAGVNATTQPAVTTTVTQTIVAGTTTIDKSGAAAPSIVTPPVVNSTTTPSILTPVTIPLTKDRQNANSSNAGTGNYFVAPAVASLNVSDTVKLMNIVAYNAFSQPEQIQQLLDSNKVPESVKPALQQALAASIAVYQTTINNLNH